MDVLNDQFGIRLKHIRKLSGLTQKELATKTNISSQIISNLERGYTRSISYQDLKKLAQHLNCEVGDLIPDAEKHVLKDVQEVEIVDYLYQAMELLEGYTNLRLHGSIPDEETRSILKAMLGSILEVVTIKAAYSKPVRSKQHTPPK